MKRAVIVHGWSGKPNEAWFPWLKKELEKKGFKVSVPQMPNADYPVISSWVKKLSTNIGTPDNELILIGHSIGCQTILRYLETINTPIKGIVLVAGWFTLTGLETEEEQQTVQPWLDTHIDFKIVKKTKSIAIFSDNDPYVPLENIKMFEKQLGAKTITLHKRGHIGAYDKCPQLPEALDAVLSLAKPL